MRTLNDLIAYCRSQARISSNDYFHPQYARPEEIKAWRQDKARRDAARRLCFRRFPGRLNSGTEPLIPGQYGAAKRLTIGANGEIDYIPGQYAALEIYSNLLAYLELTN